MYVKGNKEELWNVILTIQKCDTSVYTTEYYFNYVQMCYICLC